MKRFGIVIIAVLVLVAGVGAAITFGCQDDWCFVFPWQKIMGTNNFEECAARGFPVIESYPRQCKAGSKVFTEDVTRDQGPKNSQAPAPLCQVTGCSGQVCAEEDVITTCEYLPEYACYKNARCERQANGECGWTETQELTRCLENTRASPGFPTIE